MGEIGSETQEAVEYPPALNEQEQAVLKIFVDAVTVSDPKVRGMLVDTLYDTADVQLGYGRERIDFIYAKALLMTERELEDEDTARLEEATANLPSFHETESEVAERRDRSLGRSAIGGARSSYSPERNR